MLHQKYLPQFHFRASHRIVVAAKPEKVSKFISELDVSESWMVKALFFLRGLPKNTCKGIEGLKEMGFTVLEQHENKEIILGLVGQFWKVNGNIQPVDAEKFTSFHDDRFVKASWNFEIIPTGENQVTLETETRIFCMSEPVRKKFGRYWFFIRPFSGLIRMEMLRLIKRKAERS